MFPKEVGQDCSIAVLVPLCHVLCPGPVCSTSHLSTSDVIQSHTSPPCKRGQMASAVQTGFGIREKEVQSLQFTSAYDISR